MRINHLQRGYEGLGVLGRDEYLVVAVVAYGKPPQRQGGRTQWIVRGADGGDGADGDAQLEEEAIEHREAVPLHYIACEKNEREHIDGSCPQ